VKKKKEKRKKEKRPSTKRKPSRWMEFWEKDFFRSGLFHLLLFLFVFGLALMLRLLFLTSDPPQISWSQDLTTDAPTYVSFARAKILHGDWNPFGQYRFVLWIKSAYTLISFLFYKLVGLGRYQSNLLAVLLNLFTILFIYLAIRKTLDKNAALFSLFFLGINFIMLVYSRNTFSEISTLFFIALGFYFLILGLEKNFFLILSGASHACAFLFGKMLAAFILPVGLGVLVLVAFENFSKKRKKIKLFPLILFSIGILGAVLPWYLIIYNPVPGDVKFYLKEMSTGLYGAPVALNSIKDFIYSVFSLGYVSGIFEGAPHRPGTDFFFRMPFVFLLSCLFALFYFFKIFKGNLLEKIKSTSRAEFYLVFWLIIGFLALMPWNYRPLRYQLLIIPPICALAGTALSRFLHPETGNKKEKLNWVYWIFFIPIFTIMTFHLCTFYLRLFNKIGSFDFIVVLSALVAIISMVIWHIFLKNKTIHFKNISGIKSIGVVVIVILILLININPYISWTKTHQNSLIRTSQDLGKILNQGAVISGPYASTLTQDNNLGFCFHMFGVVRVDTLLFQRYPITHLALERRGGNKERAFKDYPEVMKDARVVTSYLLRGMPVDVYRIKEHTKNPQAESYRLSDFEKAKILIEEEKIDSAIVLLREFNRENPQNLSARLLLSEILSRNQDYEEAISELERAIEFDQRNDILHYYLGYLYFQHSDLEKNKLHWERGVRAWEKSLELNPRNLQLAQQLRKVKGY
jgi:4-amino-4-deoxy-L-arabinose transferase-like glycosyltransferase